VELQLILDFASRQFFISAITAYSIGASPIAAAQHSSILRERSFIEGLHMARPVVMPVLQTAVKLREIR